MWPGNLDRRITIRELVDGQDAAGQPIQVCQTVATVWAQFEPLRGRERFVAQQVQAELDARFRIRYRTDIHPGMHIAFGDEEYDIEAVMEIGRREGLEILASAAVGVA